MAKFVNAAGNTLNATKRVITKMGYGPFASPKDDDEARANLVLAAGHWLNTPVRIAEHAYWGSRAVRGMTHLILAGALAYGAVHVGKDYVRQGIQDAKQVYSTIRDEISAPEITYGSSVKPALETTIKELADLYRTAVKEFSEPKKAQPKPAAKK